MPGAAVGDGWAPGKGITAPAPGGIEFSDAMSAGGWFGTLSMIL